MANISTENINTLAQLAASISDGDYIYIYKAASNSFARIEKSVFMQAITGGSVASDVVKSNVNSIVDKLNELISNLANYALLDEVSQMADLDWEDGGDEPAVDTPVLTSPSGSVNVGTLAYNESTIIKTVTVKGNYLTQPLSISVSGDGFSVSTQTVSAANANNGTTISITYTNSGAGDGVTKYGSLTISSSEVSKTITLTTKKNQQSVQPSYVQDGLVLHLDGINRGGVSGHWKSLVTYNNGSGFNDYIDFTLTDATESSDHVSFNGTTSKGIANVASLDIPANGGTIEVCLKNGELIDEMMCVLHNAYGRNICFSVFKLSGYYYLSMCTGGSTQASSENTAAQTSNSSDLLQGSYSCEIDSFKHNGVDFSYRQPRVQNTDASSYLSLMYRHRSDSDAYAKGDIYSIRVYNRQLTDSERAQNYAADQYRFNL